MFCFFDQDGSSYETVWLDLRSELRWDLCGVSGLLLFQRTAPHSADLMQQKESNALKAKQVADPEWSGPRVADHGPMLGRCGSVGGGWWVLKGCKRALEKLSGYEKKLIRSSRAFC